MDRALASPLSTAGGSAGLARSRAARGARPSCRSANTRDDPRPKARRRPDGYLSKLA